MPDHELTEVNLHNTGASITYDDELLDENLPGQLNLDWATLDHLAKQIDTVRANRKSRDRFDVLVTDVQPRDWLYGNRNLQVRDVLTEAGPRLVFQCIGEYSTEIIYDDTDLMVTVWREFE